jgi:hypothetical protein
MNTQTQATLKMAIEYIQDMVKGDVSFNGVSNNQVIDACKQALEQPAQEIVEIMDLMQYGQSFTKIAAEPAQEPVAWIDEVNNTITTVQLMKYGWLGSDDRAIPDAWIKLYTHPHQWVWLTEDEIFNLRKDDYGVPSKYWDDYARAIEQALKEKNHG